MHAPLGVLLQLAELDPPAAGVTVDVPLLLVVGHGEVLETALDHLQSRRIALLAEAELHERRVPVGGVQGGVDRPGEGEEARRLHPLDPPVRGPVLVPVEYRLPAGPQVELDRVAEPAADVLGLGHDAPHHVDGGVDQDLAFDSLRDRQEASSRATKGCVTLAPGGDPALDRWITAPRPLSAPNDPWRTP